MGVGAMNVIWHMSSISYAGMIPSLAALVRLFMQHTSYEATPTVIIESMFGVSKLTQDEVDRVRNQVKELWPEATFREVVPGNHSETLAVLVELINDVAKSTEETPTPPMETIPGYNH